MSLRRRTVRRHPPENTNSKRWSQPVNENNEQEEQISSQSSYLTLLTSRLGIPKEKAERACVATGFRSVQAATDWLLQRHVDDKPIRTEFIILLCPDERLNEQIRTFTAETFRFLVKETALRDRQHLRAFKLSSFFYVPDQFVHTLHKIFDSVIRQYHSLFKQLLRVVLHSTSDYLMLIPDTDSKKVVENIFDMIKQQFEQIVPNVSITPAKKLAHLTLTHGLSSLFNLTSDQRSALIQLGKVCLDFDRSVNWTLRLYSREQSSTNEVVYRVLSAARDAAIHNCLSLKPNDLFMVLDNARTGEEENVFGRSHSTGEEGLFPLKNLRKTSETEAWTLHKSASLVNENSTNNAIEYTETNNVTATDEKNANNANESRTLSKRSIPFPRASHTNGRTDPLATASNSGVIRLFCIRHGERVDFAFGPSWPESAFDKTGKYHRVNLNMPVLMPRRRNPFRDFIGDSPITEIGASQARLTGEAFAASDSFAQYCYCSPSLRCIQTAYYMLQGMGLADRVKIRVEPGLFEFLGWYERGLPSLFTCPDMHINEDEEINLYNIDKNYRPIIPLEKLSREEKAIDYYNRSFKVTQQITDKHKLTGANIFFIGHAATLEVCTRQLCSFPPRSYSEFNGVIRKVPYLGLQLCERNPSDGQWSLKLPPIPPLQHTNNTAYDWQTMK